jgi:hypothetical protein
MKSEFGLGYSVAKCEGSIFNGALPDWANLGRLRRT